MTEDEINLIEASLNVLLPESYKSVMLDYPFEEDKGTINWSLWDRADKIIEWTKKYQEGYSNGPSWERHMILIGSDEDACPHLFNLKSGTVIKTNHGSINIEPLEEYESLDKFVEYLVSVYDDEL